MPPAGYSAFRYDKATILLTIASQLVTYEFSAFATLILILRHFSVFAAIIATFAYILLLFAFSIRYTLFHYATLTPP